MTPRRAPSACMSAPLTWHACPLLSCMLCTEMPLRCAWVHGCASDGVLSTYLNSCARICTGMDACRREMSSFLGCIGAVPVSKALLSFCRAAVLMEVYNASSSQQWRAVIVEPGR